jgi:hypothetical protein
MAKLMTVEDFNRVVKERNLNPYWDGQIMEVKKGMQFHHFEKYHGVVKARVSNDLVISCLMPTTKFVRIKSSSNIRGRKFNHLIKDQNNPDQWLYSGGGLTNIITRAMIMTPTNRNSVFIEKIKAEILEAMDEFDQNPNYAMKYIKKD